MHNFNDKAIFNPKGLMLYERVDVRRLMFRASDVR